MPTKRNRAGKQQNYVEAGHGDASGEYGDNATGSNKHFQSFKKPSRSGELDKNQTKAIGNYVLERLKYLDGNETYLKGFINSLRYYNGSFGDLSKFSDDELKEIVEEFKNLKVSDEPVYIKKGSKWEATRNVGLLEKLGINYYTKEQKAKEDFETAQKILGKSQNESDKKIQETLGGKCSVCFGKGYSKEDLQQIEKDTETYVNDFPELKDTIKGMGDRTNLEKYINAVRKNTEPSEEEITKEMAKIKKYSWYELSNEELRERAIDKLTREIKLPRLNNAYAYWDTGSHNMVYMPKMRKVTDEAKDYEYQINFHSSNKKNATFCHEMGHAVDTALEDAYKNITSELEKQMPSYEDGGMTMEEVMKKRNEIGAKIRQLEKAKDDFDTNITRLKYQNANNNYNETFRNTFKEKYGVFPDDMNLDYSTREARKEQVAKELFDNGVRKYNLSKYGATNKSEFVAESFSAYYTGMNNKLANEVVEAFKNYAKELRGFKQ